MKSRQANPSDTSRTFAGGATSNERNLSGTELRVEKLFDQRGLGAFLANVASAALEHLPQCVHQVDQTERPLIRCAPHSALMRLHGTLQTFSVYDLKNVP
jgi:hypothetical protein